MLLLYLIVCDNLNVLDLVELWDSDIGSRKYIGTLFTEWEHARRARFERNVRESRTIEHEANVRALSLQRLQARTLGGLLAPRFPSEAFEIRRTDYAGGTVQSETRLNALAKPTRSECHCPEYDVTNLLLHHVCLGNKAKECCTRVRIKFCPQVIFLLHTRIKNIYSRLITRDI